MRRVRAQNACAVENADRCIEAIGSPTFADVTTDAIQPSGDAFRYPLACSEAPTCRLPAYEFRGTARSTPLAVTRYATKRFELHSCVITHQSSAVRASDRKSASRLPAQWMWQRSSERHRRVRHRDRYRQSNTECRRSADQQTDSHPTKDMFRLGAHGAGRIRADCVKHRRARRDQDHWASHDDRDSRSSHHRYRTAAHR